MACFIFQSVVLMSLILGAASQECTDQGVCVPGPIDVAHRINNHVGIRASGTCGDPPSKFCRMRPLNKCFVCDANNESLSHEVIRIRDKKQDSSWQSPTWWDWYQQNPDEPLKANVTISFNKSYVLTGEVLIVWMSPRPFKMILEKSLDYGKSWSALQYYAENCEKRFNGMVNSDMENITVGNFGVYCTEKYSALIQEQGKIIFNFLQRYDEENFWDPEYQDYLSATDLRIRMEYPATDGSENTNKIEDVLNQYFYAISDVHITARCQCHGHAKFCDSPNLEGYGCDCKNYTFTTGPDCERCKPLYNNKAWMPATSWNDSYACQKCECHEHADSCVYNKTLDHGVCDDCQHNTTGYFCEQCKVKFYRNLSKTLEHPKVCLPCDCFPEGILNNGSCNQTTGQCECRQNVTGRQCNRCEDTFWGYTLHPVGYCQECKCIGNGTKKGSLNCDQVNAQCDCKETIWTKTCSECIDGYYDFPKTENGTCQECDCDYGGSKKEICEKVNGTCLCRSHIEGERCTAVPPGYFFPSFSHLTYEAEFASEGNFLSTSYYEGINRYFTGRGYGKLSENRFVTFYVNASVDFDFSVVLRYTENEQTKETLQMDFISCSAQNCSTETRFSVPQLELGKGRAVQLNETVTLRSGRSYIFNLTFVSGEQFNSTVEIDSLVLVPIVQDSRVYKMAKLGKVQGFNAETIVECAKNWTTLEGSNSAQSICRIVTFSVMAEVFDGALACGCNNTGTLNGTQCNAFGGQCHCKPGVTGRSCDRCLPGYYNFTDQGCQSCRCVDTGSVNLVCDPVTGQCPCKAGVITRTCSRCNDSYFGFETGKGCEACGCNVNGSVDMQCHGRTGQCPCKNSTDGKQCDRCKENFFNFTSLGCDYCNCHEGGSKSSQCHLQTGLCTCKANANGTKCELCKPGTYHSDPQNPDGCSPCFCYGRSRVCSSAKGFVKSYIRATCNDSQCKANVAGKSPSFQDVDQAKIIGFFNTSEVNLTLPNNFKGVHLRSYGQRIEVNLTFVSDASLNMSWKVVLKSDNGAHAFQLQPAPSLSVKNYYVILHESYAEVKVTAHEFQRDLANLRSVKLMAKSSVQGSVKVGEIRMVTAVKEDGSGGEQVGFVENCSCPFNYTSESCGLCHDGYTRSPSNSGYSNPCFLCSCNNRSRDCNPENGTCYDCRIGTEGDRCERCEPNVDNSTDCRRCYPEFYGLTEISRGCKACDCVLENTRYGNNSVCNMTSGNCLCKPKISGRQCDRCHENAYNSSSVCVDCPECYRLVQVEAIKLREAIYNLSDTVKRVKNGQIGDATFEVRFNNARREVEDLVGKSKNSTAREEELRVEVKKLNQTLNQLEAELNANVKPQQEFLESNVSSLDRLKGNVSGLISETGQFVNESYALLTTSIGPGVRKAENLSTYLGNLAPTFSQLSSNSSAEAARQKTTGHEIAGNASKVDQLISEAENVSQQATGDLDVVNRIIQELYTYAQKTKDFGLRVNGSAYDLYTNASVVLMRVLESRDAVRQLQPNNSKHVNEVEAAAANATAHAQGLIDRAAKLTQDYADQTKEVQEAAMKTRELMQRVAEADERGSIILSEAQRAKAEGQAAVDLANKTHADSKDMLSILQNFTKKAAQAKEVADKALRRAEQVNETSWKAIRYAHQLNESLQSTHWNASESERKAQMARDLSEDENKNVSSVHVDAVNLQTRADATKHTPQYLQSVKENTTAIQPTSKKHNELCINYTKEAEEARKRSEEVVAESEKADNISKSIKKEVDRVLIDVGRLQQVNATRLGELQREITRISKEFTGQNVEDLTNELKVAKKKQEEFLKDYKQKVKNLKEEIAELTQLHESLQSVSCR